MTTLARRSMGIEDIVDSVQLKNRIVDGSWSVTYDGRQITWGAGETKQLPRKHAEWFLAKSLYKFNPGDQTYGEPAQYHYVLAIVGQTDETPITIAEARRKELLDRESMPAKMDETTNKPLRTVYIDPRGTGASTIALDRREARATREVSSAIVSEAAEQIADAAQHASEREIEDAVAGLTGVPAQA